MCGIAGILTFDPGERVDGARLERMRDALTHRGPDSAGSCVTGQIGLAHRRLSIVDLAGGQQPMANEDESMWVVFNGEIYNHAHLRPALEQCGHCYRTRSDTETILHLYEEDGDDVVHRLQGMFAFAIWDAVNGRLLLARDRLGIKPLYYAVTSHELLFASEIKAILAAGGVRASFNERVLPEFLATRFVAGDETFFRGIRKLLPGRTLSWSREGGLCERRYWALSTTAKATEGSLAEQAQELRAHLSGTVRSHLMSDVPVGLFLSGGIDSSGLASIMAPMVDHPVQTFSVGFTEQEASELDYARIAAKAIGARHHEVVVSASEFFDALPRLVWHEDEPIAFPSSVPLYFVSRLARQHVKVVLTGEGADELFLGYNRYRVTAWNERLGRIYGQVLPHAVREQLGRFVTALPPAAGRYATRSFLVLQPNPRTLFFDNFAVFSDALRERVLVPDAHAAPHDPYAEGLECYQRAGGGALQQMAAADLQTYLVELLMKQDQMSMAASIESRVPFLDHLLVEYAMRIPPSFKVRGWQTKAVLRAALQDVVPGPILTRRKMGFPVPLSRWFRGAFWPLIEEVVLGPRSVARGFFDVTALRQLAEEHRAGAANHADRLWLLLNLEIWQRVFIDGEDALDLKAAA